jgi:hypothetical protein
MSRSFVSMRGVALHTLTGPRYRRGRRGVGRLLRGCGAVLFWASGLPLAVGRGLMWLAGRARGWAYEVELDR